MNSYYSPPGTIKRYYPPHAHVSYALARLCLDYGHLWEPPYIEHVGDEQVCLRCDTKAVLMRKPGEAARPLLVVVGIMIILLLCLMIVLAP